MQTGYSCIGKKLSAVSKQLAVVVGLIAIPVSLKLEGVSAPAFRQPTAAKVQQTVSTPVKPDPRKQCLRSFFAKLHCPVSNLTDDFIQAADDNELDWRLLPSIAVIESGGGKAYRNNNIFGWDNGDHLFPTIRSAIHEVAFKLGKSSLYRNRGIEEKLHLYNPDQSYAQNVMTVMNRISPVVELQPVAHVYKRADQFTYATD